MRIIPSTLYRFAAARPVLRKVLLGCGVASSVLYLATDIIASRRYQGYSYVDQEFSELTAEGAPTRNLMIALNVIPYDLLVAAFALGVRMSIDDRDAGRATAMMLAGYAALGTAGGLIFPMRPRGNAQTLRNLMHIPATATMSLFVLLAIGFGSRLLGHRFRIYSYGTIAMLLGCGGLASMQAGRLTKNEPTPWMGVEERVNIYATMIWIAVLSSALLAADEGNSVIEIEG